MTEDCPNCGTDVLVGGAQGPYYRWQCHGCGERWGELDIEPIAYDAVDAWYEPRSPDGTRLHSERNCPSTDSVMAHTPMEARENRHERCLTCGHEVIES
jgi:hypothetical protein